MQDPDSIRAWLNGLDKDRAWLAERIGVSKRTLDNWFSDGFPCYALKSIGMIDRLEKAPAVADEEAISLPPKLSKELFRRSEESGFGGDYLGYVNALLRHALNLPPPQIKKDG